MSFQAIHSRYDIEKPNVQRLIRRKLNIINRLKEENRALKQAALEEEKALVSMPANTSLWVTNA